MTDQVREQVRQRYAAAATAVAITGRDALAVVDAAPCCAPAGTQATASCCTPGATVDAAFGSALYSAGEQGELPAQAVAASLGCGNPMAVADLHAGERVLDLGSGGGIDVLLSARRVGPTGFAYGVDMTQEMLELANANKAKAGAENVAFLHGTIEDVPLPDAAVDVVISNCVINLSTDKPAVLAEMFRVLTPGGRVGVSDVVAEDHLTPQMRAERGSYVGCIAGALSRAEFLDGLAAAGFTDADVTFTHEAAPGLHGAIVRATKPAQPGSADQCCPPAEQATCCEPSAKAACCSGEHPAGSCGCQPDTTNTAPTAATPTGASLTAPTPTAPILTGSSTVTTVDVFEPALCCTTGVCGEDVDQALVTFTADADWATANGARVVRHNLASEPIAFAGNDAVKRFLQLSGSAGLPLVLVDGVTVLTGTYPDRGQLARWAALDTSADTGVDTAPAVGTAPAADTVPAGARMLGLADAGCCSTDTAESTGCC